MQQHRLTAYCLTKRGAADDYPFGPHPLVMKVGGKMFALIAGSGEDLQISLKCDPFIAENLREQHDCVRPGYHLNKKHWNTVTVDGSMPEEELQAMIDHSYDLVVRSLPKAKRLELK
ncbi:MmcQ/YjbR family DNA-binding protein [Gorillibacterium sp. sgz5001074]|uniref:MmcQ/YjbR family DNA-binding protein n=1 Tax=Gorillibacterium sp. sgz5001074 TaxID=3446695 RepID=UPI003F679DE0